MYSLNVFVKTKLSQLGIKMSMRLGSWVTNHVGMKVKHVWLVCQYVQWCSEVPAGPAGGGTRFKGPARDRPGRSSRRKPLARVPNKLFEGGRKSSLRHWVCVTEPAVCGNEDRLLWTCLQLHPDPGSLETKFWEIVWADEEKMGAIPKKSRSNISGMVWVTTTKLSLLEHTVNSSITVFSDVLDEGWWNASHPQFPEIRCWTNGVQLQGPSNDRGGGGDEVMIFHGERRRNGGKLEEPEL